MKVEEHACDKCGVEVDNGHGYYPFGDTNDRVCRACDEEIRTHLAKKETEATK
jgi:hypothetical protein